jgi:predicted SAM-dependent methyltransferase
VTPRVLHAGCGTAPLPEWLPGQETRLDIDPGVSPDITAPMTALGDIGPFDIVYCSHVLEHMPPHEIEQALREIRRVLVPGGFLIVIVPNLANVAPNSTVVYVSPAGPITGLDMYYGMATLVQDNPYMAHKYGFVPETLRAFLARAGFEVKHLSDSNFNLMVTAQR